MSHHNYDHHHDHHHHDDEGYYWSKHHHHHHHSKHEGYRAEACGCHDDEIEREPRQGHYLSGFVPSGWSRHFISPDERKEALEGYIDGLKKELAGAESELSKL